MPKRKRYQKTYPDFNYCWDSSESNSENDANQDSDLEDCYVDSDSNVVKKTHKASIDQPIQQESDEQESDEQESSEQENITQTFPDKAIYLKIRDSIEKAFQSFQYFTYGSHKKLNYGPKSHKIFTAKKMINKTPYLKNIILIQPDENLDDEKKLEQGKKTFECIAQLIALTKNQNFSRKQTDCMILNDKTAAFEEKNQVKNRKQKFIANFLPPDTPIGTVGVRSRPIRLLREKIKAYLSPENIERLCNNPNNNNIMEDNDASLLDEEILKVFPVRASCEESDNESEVTTNSDDEENDEITFDFIDISSLPEKNYNNIYSDNEIEISVDDRIEENVEQANNEVFSNISNSQINEEINNNNNINELSNNEKEISVDEEIEENINHRNKEPSVSNLLDKITFFKKERESLKHSRHQLKANIVELENKSLKYQRKIEKQLNEEEQKFLREQKKLEEARKNLESKNEEVKALKETWKSLQKK